MAMVVSNSVASTASPRRTPRIGCASQQHAASGADAAAVRSDEASSARPPSRPKRRRATQSSIIRFTKAPIDDAYASPA